MLHQVKHSHRLFFRIGGRKNKEKCNWSHLDDPKVSTGEKLSHLVGAEWPDLKEEVDVICFQEVWDIYSALPLIAALRTKAAVGGGFSDFIFNAQRCTMEDNLVVFGCKCCCPKVYYTVCSKSNSARLAVVLII